jgi:formate dehydrogenase major subunit
MSRPAPRGDIDESELSVSHAEDHAAGPTAVAVSLERAVEQMGVRRTAQTLLKLNQADGFDCQGCAWPDPSPEHRHTAEFCENGAKAVTEEATLRRVGREFFAAHSVADLHNRTDYWWGQQGRITEEMVLRADGTHYEPISWEDAFALVAGHLNGLASPDQAVFYTSGKVSNEAAFAYQLFVRAYGTNNLPDCSNMCRESTSVGLAEVIGIGKASVSLRTCTRPSFSSSPDRTQAPTTRACSYVGDPNTFTADVSVLAPGVDSTSGDDTATTSLPPKKDVH